MNLKAVDLHSCEIGTISSRADASVTVRFSTAELRPSEAGALMAFHGKAARIAIFPHDTEPEEKIEVTTERDRKTPSQRLRASLFLLWKKEGQPGTYDDFYAKRMEKLIEHVQSKLDQ